MKFSGAGHEVQLKLEQSLNNLDFIPRLWNVSGKKVGLAQLCDAKEAAELRDALVKEDHLSLALELCRRCGGEDKTNEQTASWHISADPVREAQVVALQRLSMFEEARNEFSRSGASMQAAENALTAFEDAMRYPPLYDLAALEQQRSIYTFNRLQRKLYRSTATMASLPIFLQQTGGRESDQAVPIVPISKSPESVLQISGKKANGKPETTENAGGSGGSVTLAASMQVALEDRLRDALHQRRRRCKNDTVTMKDDFQAHVFPFFQYESINNQYVPSRMLYCRFWPTKGLGKGKFVGIHPVCPTLVAGDSLGKLRDLPNSTDSSI